MDHRDRIRRLFDSITSQSQTETPIANKQIGSYDNVNTSNAVCAYVSVLS